MFASMRFLVEIHEDTPGLFPAVFLNNATYGATEFRFLRKNSRRF